MAMSKRNRSRLFRHHSLSLVLLAIFLSCLAAQVFAGWRVFNADQRDHGEPTVSVWQYLRTPHFVEATAENWESEFLQMGMFVWLTSLLHEKGSPESNDPDEEPKSEPVTADSPWPVRRGGIALRLYENSLAGAFLLMFAVSVALHAAGGARAYSQEQLAHGQPAVSVTGYLATSQFWFESTQNWQSEFLSIAAMVVLSVYLRQRNSPESKPVEASHERNE